MSIKKQAFIFTLPLQKYVQMTNNCCDLPNCEKKILLHGI